MRCIFNWKLPTHSTFKRLLSCLALLVVHKLWVQNKTFCICFAFIGLSSLWTLWGEINSETRPVWLNWLNIILQGARLLVDSRWGYVSGLWAVPSWVCARGNQLKFLSLFFSLHSSFSSKHSWVVSLLRDIWAGCRLTLFSYSKRGQAEHRK